MAKNTLQRRLLFYFLMVALIPFILIISYYFFNMQSISHDQIIDDNQSYLDNAMEEIENQRVQVNEFANWVLSNQTIRLLLQRAPEQANTYDAQFETAVNELQQQFYYRPVTKYIRSLFLIGKNSLDIRNGIEASLFSQNEIQQMIEQHQQTRMHWNGRIQNPIRLTQDSNVLMYKLSITDMQTGEQCGWLVILFSEDIFSKSYEGLIQSGDNTIWLSSGEGFFLSGHNPGDKTDGISLTSTSISTGWTLHEQILETTMQKQFWILVRTVLFLGLIMIWLILILSWTLSRSLAMPIERIVARVRMISNGEFPAPEYRNEETEMDYLENRILDMQNDIQTLMKQQIDREKERQKLEIQVLQSQMNPHFLYNTLNSIRLMASMQGKKSIASMIDALGKLLRANLSVQRDTIPLKMELELLDSYLHIQNISQKGKLKWDDSAIPENMLQQAVPKFLLQPLAENAVLHGLTPQAEELEIRISAELRGEDCFITVSDNGVGMSEHRLDQLRCALGSKGEIKVETDHGHGIALKNVQKRIHLHYGEQFGLRIDSGQNEGCCVTVHLPCERMEGRRLNEGPKRADC